MTLPSDPGEALKWAMNHSGDAWWLIGLIIGGIAWTTKRLRDWGRASTPPPGSPRAKAAAAQRWTPGTPAVPPPAVPKPAAAASSYTAAPSYTASGYAAQPAYAPPPAAAPAHGGPARKLHREGGGAQRAPAPVARSVDVPTPTGAWTIAGAFGDPAHARTAIVIAEVLGPPVGLR